MTYDEVMQVARERWGPAATSLVKIDVVREGNKKTIGATHCILGVQTEHGLIYKGVGATWEAAFDAADFEEGFAEEPNDPEE